MRSTDSSVRRFYVYVLFRPNGTPCYVGKGTNYRVAFHNTVGRAHYNKHLGHIVAKAGGNIPAVVVRAQLTEAEAFETEIALIKALGRASSGTGPLVNLTDGGDGQAGWIPTAETRQKISQANAGSKLSDLTRQRMSKAAKGKKKDAAWRKAIGESQRGRTASDETRAKQRAAAARRWARPEEHQKLKAHHANRSADDKAARAAKISKATRAAMTQEVRAKVSEARKRACQR